MKLSLHKLLNKILLALLISIIFVSKSISFSQVAHQQEVLPSKSDKPGDELNAEKIIELNKPALISIWYHTDNYFSYYSNTSKDTTLLNGSGFIFDESGLIGTNYHVVDGIDSLLVKTSDGSFYDAELIIVDEKNDMAMLRLKNTEGRKFPCIKLGNTDDIKVGQDVFAIGSPFGYEYTISQGIVAGIRENESITFNDPVTYLPIEKKFTKVIQITAAISPGNSGGALFNNKGDVIGITTFTYAGYGNLNFAIAINSFIKFKNSIDIANLDNNEETIRKREESIFNTNLKLADNYKDQVSYNWFYTRQKDTMKTLDTFIVRQDSIVRLNFLKAENYYNKCIQMAPDSFDVYQEMMDLYVFTESYNKAESLYIMIRGRFDSDSLLSLLSSSLASAYSSSKEYKKALQFYDKMLKKDTGDVYINFQRATIFEKMNNYPRAISELEQIIRKDTDYIQAYIELGKIYYEKFKNFKKARLYLESANELEMTSNGYYSTNVDIHYYLGMIAIKEGKKMQAILAYLELKNIYTYSPEDNLKKLNLYKEIKKLDY